MKRIYVFITITAFLLIGLIGFSGCGKKNNINETSATPVSTNSGANEARNNGQGSSEGTPDSNTSNGNTQKNNTQVSANNDLTGQTVDANASQNKGQESSESTMTSIMTNEDARKDDTQVGANNSVAAQTIDEDNPRLPRKGPAVNNKVRTAPKTSQKKLRDLLLEYGVRKGLDEGETPDRIVESASVQLLYSKAIEDDIDIHFYPENSTCTPGAFAGAFEDKDALVGFHTLENGFTFLGCAAGEDGEYVPAFYIVYFDGERLRVYFPKEGTVYNKKWMCLFGSESEMGPVGYMPGQDFDKKQILADFPEKTSIINKLFYGDMCYEEAAQEICEWYGKEKDIVWSKVKADIIRSIKITG